MDLPDDDLLQPQKWKLSWRRVGFILVASVIFLLVGLELIWGWVARRQLNAEIAAIRASAEPIDAKDFQPAAIPDADNGAWYYQKAAEATHFDDVNLRGELWTTPPSREEFAALYANLELDKPALDWVTQAEKCNRVVWPLPQSITTPEPKMPDLNKQRVLAETLEAFAWLEESQGQDDLAIERVAEMLRLGDA